MKKVDSYSGYDFYIHCGDGDNPNLYNIVKTGDLPPVGGYPNRRYIERIKGIKFPDKYQPTKYGKSETYLSDEWSGI